MLESVAKWEAWLRSRPASAPKKDPALAAVLERLEALIGGGDPDAREARRIVTVLRGPKTGASQASQPGTERR
jgi:hypothetical protein